MKLTKKTASKVTAGLLCTSLLAGCGSTATTTESEDSSASAADITVTAESDILGMADTGNKTSLKQTLVYTSGPGDINLYYYNEDGERVQYEDQSIEVELDPVAYTGSAEITIEGAEDDSLIDSSNASVHLVDGNGYYADEYILNADSLDGTWENGTYTYTLSENDLEFNTWDYDTSTDYNSDREWSFMAGDGNGVYRFTFEVTGITYDGEELPAVQFPVTVYIYGRSAADQAYSTEYVENTVDESYRSELAQTDEVQWDWYTEDETSMEDKPYMNDMYTDYFTVVWPEGSDAADLTADDVTVTLTSAYGDEYVLSEETDYGEHEVSVISYEDQTVIAVTYQQWAYTPVFNAMTISVDNGDLSAETTYDISSVRAYMVQTGGGGVTVDHTVTTYNYYGLTNLTEENAYNADYTLSVEIDDVTYYYAEDADGNGYLSEGIAEEGERGISWSAPEDAWIGDATEYNNIALRSNVVFAETREDNTEDKEVDGETVTFTRNVSVSKDVDSIVADGAELESGYNLADVAITSWWSYTDRYQSGWLVQSDEPTGLPYVSSWYGFEAGSSNPAYDELAAELAAEE